MYAEFTQNFQTNVSFSVILYSFWESIYKLLDRFLEMLISMKCVRLFSNKALTAEFSLLMLKNTNVQKIIYNKKRYTW